LILQGRLLHPAVTLHFSSTFARPDKVHRDTVLAKVSITLAKIKPSPPPVTLMITVNAQIRELGCFLSELVDFSQSSKKIGGSACG
jgi:hypothetical protein